MTWAVGRTSKGTAYRLHLFCAKAALFSQYSQILVMDEYTIIKAATLASRITFQVWRMQIPCANQIPYRILEEAFAYESALL